MSEKEQAVREMVKKYGQEHLLQKYEQMSEQDKEILLDQIQDIDFDQILKLYDNTKKEIELGDDKIEPISYINKYKLSDEEKSKYKKIGEDAIRAGKLGFITMAGGQGTRLGHKGPKGTFKLIGEKTLFEIFTET